MLTWTHNNEMSILHKRTVRCILLTSMGWRARRAYARERDRIQARRYRGSLTKNEDDMVYQRYRKRPVEIEAVQLTRENFYEVAEWVEAKECWALESPNPALHIKTLEGTMLARLGDFVIKGIQGEFYPCASDIFEQTYERV